MPMQLEIMFDNNMYHIYICVEMFFFFEIIFMELVVGWISMAIVLFLRSNMIDVIVAIAPFTTPFCVVMLF
jgi:hypothetical protein